METDMNSAVSRWLTQIMPDVVAALTDWLTPDIITEMGKHQGIHGPYSLSIEKFKGPITHINFYFTVVPPTMLMAVTASFEGDAEDYEPPVSFDMVFTINNFATKIADEHHRQRLVNTLMQQYQQLL